MSTQTTPPILLELGGIEDFETAIAMLRATGARWLKQRRSSRTFVIDHDLTAEQAAVLVDFIAYGTAEGFLKVETNAPELDYDGAEEWWETARHRAIRSHQARESRILQTPSLTVAAPCIWHGSGTDLGRRQSATTAGAPTDQARVCLAAPTCLGHAIGL
jgi:hypothetical protein